MGDQSKAKPMFQNMDPIYTSELHEIVEGQVTDRKDLDRIFTDNDIDIVMSCIASRSGAPKDSWDIDCYGNVKLLDAGLDIAASNDTEETVSNERKKIKQFIMLSAFCVEKPYLQFQFAKKKFEEYLESLSLSEEHNFVYSVIRPTAFFKSVSGQLEILQKGAPYVMFGDGKICSCNPIAESDLATYLVNSISNRN